MGFGESREDRGDFSRLERPHQLASTRNQGVAGGGIDEVLEQEKAVFLEARPPFPGEPGFCRKRAITAPVPVPAGARSSDGSCHRAPAPPSPPCARDPKAGRPARGHIGDDEIASTLRPSWRATIASGTVDMPTVSAPSASGRADLGRRFEAGSRRTTCKRPDAESIPCLAAARSRACAGARPGS